MAITFECRSCGARAETEPGGAALVCPACGVPMAPVGASAAPVKTAMPIATPVAGATPKITAPPTVKRAMPVGVPPAGVAAATAALAGVKVARRADQTITASGVSGDTTKRLQALKERAAGASAEDFERLRDEALRQVRAEAQDMLNQARIQEQEIVRRAQQAAAAEMGKAREVFDAEVGKARELAVSEAAQVKEQARKDAAAIREEAEARCRQETERALAASRETASAEAKKIVSQGQADAEKKAAELLAEARRKAAADQEQLLAEARQQAAAEVAKLKEETARKLEDDRKRSQEANRALHEEAEKQVGARPPPGVPAKVPAFPARKPVWGRGPVATVRREMAPGGKGPATPGAAAETGVRPDEPRAAAAPAPRPVGYRDADTHGMSDVEKAHYMARRDLLDEHAKKEAKNLMFGLSASAVLAFYLLYVLFRGNLVQPLRHATIGVLSADALFVLWQVWTVVRHFMQGTKAAAAHKERLKSAAAMSAASRPAPRPAGSGPRASLTSKVLSGKGPTSGRPAVAPAPAQVKEIPASVIAPVAETQAVTAKTDASAPAAPAVRSAEAPSKPVAVPRPAAESAATSAEMTALKAELAALKSETAALKSAAETARKDADAARAEAVAAKDELATKKARRQVSTVPVDADLPQLFDCDGDEFVLGIRKPRLPPEDGSGAPPTTVASKRERLVPGLWGKLFAGPASLPSGNNQPATSPPKG